MDYIFSETLDFGDRITTSSEFKSLRRQLASLARWHRLQKFRLKRFSCRNRRPQNNGLLMMLKRKIWKHTRLKRILANRVIRYRHDPGQLFASMLRVVDFFKQKLTLEDINVNHNLHCYYGDILSQPCQFEDPNHLDSQTIGTSSRSTHGAKRKRKTQRSSNIESHHFSINDQGHYATTWDFGPPMHTCQHCGAILWYEERCKRTTQTDHPKFMLCCMQGRVRIPLLKEPPTFLKYLLSPDSGEKGAKYKKDIRAYNSMFAFSSIGGNIDGSINLSKGPYVFRMSGQNYHRIGSLLPEHGNMPKFAQLYIYDTENEITNRISTLQKIERKQQFDPEIVTGLSKMLDEHNCLVKSFRMVRDRFEAQPDSTFRLRLFGNRKTNGREYNMPTVSEVAGLIVGDFTAANSERDIIVEHRSNGLQRITDIPLNTPVW